MMYFTYKGDPCWHSSDNPAHWRLEVNKIPELHSFVRVVISDYMRMSDDWDVVLEGTIRDNGCSDLYTPKDDCFHGCHGYESWRFLSRIVEQAYEKAAAVFDEEAQDE